MISQRDLDQVKTAAFLDSNAAFLGSILCNMQLIVTNEIQTAATNGKLLLWNEDFFNSLTLEERKAVLLHELWHVAKLHSLRQESRDSTRWNIACDLRINYDLIGDGYVLPKGGLFDSKYDSSWSEEKIYDDIEYESFTLPMQDLIGEGEAAQAAEQISIVQQAVQQANILGGKVPGSVTETLRDFLKPKLPWWRLLREYLTQQMEDNWTWTRPNKKFHDVYLPSFRKDEGRLEHIVLFLDTSGSIEPEEVKQFNSEAKYIQEVLNPEKLTVVQFDTKIQKITEFTEDKPYKNIAVIGRGGTSLKEVYDYIVKNKPTCSIIFSDLYCDPMPKVNTPVIWVIQGDHTEPSFGKSFRI